MNLPTKLGQCFKFWALNCENLNRVSTPCENKNKTKYH